MKELLYARVNEPSELRRELLTATKQLIESLKSYEQYKLIRQEKHLLVAEVNELTMDIASSMRKLKMHFPKTDIKLKIPKKETKTAPKIEVPKKSQKNKLQVLEYELGKIEAKLSGLQ